MYDLNELFIGLIFSILLGALIGSQREIRQQKFNFKDFAGFRTFTLISLFGFLIGYISKKIILDYNLFLLSFFGLFLILFISYRSLTKLNPSNISSTTMITALLTFIIGFLVSQNLYQFSIALAILITSILYLGNSLHRFTKKLNETEIFATLKFAIISLVILPLLPNKDYSPLNLPLIGKLFSSQKVISHELLSQLDVFNFYKIWLMVVFISGIAYVGYILMKTIGAKKGIQITGFLGGLISSTAVTSSFAIESKKLNYLSVPLAVGVIIACSTMFFRIIIEVLVLNPELLVGITILLGIMGLVGYISAIYIYNKIKLNHVKTIKFDSPFTITPALKFSLLFLIVIFFSKLSSILLGNKGVYIVSFFSGLTDVDAITFSLSNLAKINSIPNSTAQIGILIAAFANTIVKAGIAYFVGSKKFSKFMILMSLIILLTGLFILVILYFFG